MSKINETSYIIKWSELDECINNRRETDAQFAQWYLSEQVFMENILPKFRRHNKDHSCLIEFEDNYGKPILVISHLPHCTTGPYRILNGRERFLIWGKELEAAEYWKVVETPESLEQFCIEHKLPEKFSRTM